MKWWIWKCIWSKRLPFVLFSFNKNFSKNWHIYWSLIKRHTLLDGNQLTGAKFLTHISVPLIPQRNISKVCYECSYTKSVNDCFYCMIRNYLLTSHSLPVHSLEAHLQVQEGTSILAWFLQSSPPQTPVIILYEIRNVDFYFMQIVKIWINNGV